MTKEEQKPEPIVEKAAEDDTSPMNKPKRDTSPPKKQNTVTKQKTNRIENSPFAKQTTKSPSQITKQKTNTKDNESAKKTEAVKKNNDDGDNGPVASGTTDPEQKNDPIPSGEDLNDNPVPKTTGEVVTKTSEEEENTAGKN